MIGGLVWCLAGANVNGLLTILVGLIFVALYLDANGVVHEVRKRPAKRLTTDFSVLGEKNTMAGQSVSEKLIHQPKAS
ncbi:hypothetical protein Pla108_23910 [Botrimarina colliarenosi]|uniref:Uncharacterized protein n=2 Tax=Botrimarina colliarenosi TaxID=2528001 RepID=A0A5C6A9E4_9BACT|nr:hypothetical protein Pla108_23910 [Botrimarina colliarenosi]